MTDTFDRLTSALADRYAIERELSAILGGERFLNEIKVTANLQHPNILPLYDSGEADTFLYYVMPYVEGDTLRDKLDRHAQRRRNAADGHGAQLVRRATAAHRELIRVDEA